MTLTAGTRFAEGRGSVMGFVGYSDRSQISNSAREFSSGTKFYLGPGEGDVGPENAFIYLGSSATDEGAADFFTPETRAKQEAVFNALFASYGYPAGTVPFPQEVGFNDDGTLFTTGTGESPSVANFHGAGDPLTSNAYGHGYNFGRYVGLQMPLERTSAFAAASFELSETLEVHGQALYGDYSVRSRVAPVVVNPEIMPPTNPYIPADLQLLLDSRVDPDAVFAFRKRFTAIGPRDYRNDYDTLQVTAGLRGQLPRDWSFDAYAQYGASDQEKFVTGNLSRTRLLELTFAEDGGLAVCGGFDVFGVDSISPACADYIAADAELVAEVPAVYRRGVRPRRALRAACGSVARSLRHSVSARRVLAGWQRGLQCGGARRRSGPDRLPAALTSTRTTTTPISILRSLCRCSATGRASRPSRPCSATAIRTTRRPVAWTPGRPSCSTSLCAPVMLRGSYQRAVRVPSIFELYEPARRTSPSMRSPAVSTATSADRPGRGRGLVRRTGRAGGAACRLLRGRIPGGVWRQPGPRPRESRHADRGHRAPLTVRVAGTCGSAAVARLVSDRDRRRDHFLATADSVVNCFDPAFNPGFAVDNFWCTQFRRDPANGTVVDAFDAPVNLLPHRPPASTSSSTGTCRSDRAVSVSSG